MPACRLRQVAQHLWQVIHKLMYVFAWSLGWGVQGNGAWSFTYCNDAAATTCTISQPSDAAVSGEVGNTVWPCLALSEHQLGAMS